MRAVLCLTLFALPAFAQKQFGFDNTKSSGQPYLTPQESLKRITVPPEFEVGLFAGEPLLVNPIAFTVDERGRIWVIESFEYPSRTPPGKMPRDRIVILEDTDGDGTADKRTVFAEGKDFPERFDMASGLEVGHGGVYVGAPPFLYFIENKNDRPGKFEKLASGFGSQDTHETLNTFQWGPDGWLYGMQGVFTQSTVKPLDGPETRMNAAVWRLHPKTKKFEIFAEGTSNPWGMDWRNTDGQFILACCVIPHLYHIVPGGVYKRQAGASYNPYAYGEIKEICDHTFHKESGWAHAGLISLDAPHIPEKYRNSVIFGSIHGCSVKQNILKPNGSSYTASRGDDFLVSGDKNFRPINMKWGPNGDIYLIDWHDQNPCHQAKPDAWDYERGRVYRINVKGRASKAAENLGQWSATQLLKALESTDPYLRRTSLRLLQQTQPKAAPGEVRGDGWGGVALIESVKTGNLPMLWLLSNIAAPAAEARELAAGLAADFAAVLPPMLEDHSTSAGWVVRTAADHPNPKLVEHLTAAVGKAPVTARRELASAAVKLADSLDVSPLVRALMSHKEDATDPQIPHLTWLAYEKVLTKMVSRERERPEDELTWLATAAPGNPFVTDYIVPRTMRRLVATGRPELLAGCVKFAADVNDSAARVKALEGLALELKDRTVGAPAEWAAFQTKFAADATVGPLVNKLAVNFRDPAAVKRAFETLRDAKNTPENRAEAVRTLALLKPAEAKATFLTVLRQGFPPAVKTEAARGLAAFADADVPDAVLKDWPQYSPAVRGEVVNTLSGRKEWATKLLQAVKAKTVDRTLLTDTTITRIGGFNDAALNKLIEDAWGKTRKTPAELQVVIDKMRGELNAAPGDFARGKKVFETQCAKCHKFDGAGAEVGPALDGAGRDIEYLLANVLDPNRVIGAPYFVRQANLLDGQLIQGVLAAEDYKSVGIKTENGVVKTIQKADLDGPVKVLEKSLMPEGLGYNMTAQDFRDLVRYVMADPFVQAATADGTAIKAGVTGKLPVPKGAKAVTFLVDSAADFNTFLLVGSADAADVFVQGKKVGSVPAGKDLAPDRASLPVRMQAGKLEVKLVFPTGAGGQGLFVRLKDPDRKLKAE